MDIGEIDPEDFEMDDEEIEEFIQGKGYGVLSLYDGEPYGIPISFGYDPDRGVCVMEFVSLPHSRKEAAVDEGARASLTVFERGTSTEWKSVVLSGEIVTVPEEELEGARKIFAEQGELISPEAWGGDFSDAETNWYELKIEKRSGKKAYEPD